MRVCLDISFRVLARAFGVLLCAGSLFVASLSAQSPEQPADDNHVFGVIPNFATVENPEAATPIDSHDKFRIVWLDTFDRYVFPYVGVVAAIERQYGGGTSGYVKQYAASFTDNAVSNYLTGAVLPSILRQDPRYFERGHGPVLHRAVYAASRTLVARSDAGRNQFNVSEVAGNAVAATVSELYYPRADRSFNAALTRGATQLAFDALANELKEFWPDIHRKIHRR